MYKLSDRWLSRWNMAESKTAYNRLPTIKEVNATVKNKKIITDDGLIMFFYKAVAGGRDFIEVRGVVENSFTVNRYQDFYHIKQA